MKLSDWAKKQGISYLTAYRWFKDGKLPIKAYQSDSGTIIVQDEELESSEETVASQNNDVMSLLLKKTVEFSKNNASIEDFAAYILSNFSLKLNSGSDHPKYSRNKPKPEDIQKHFQQFLKPQNQKPKPTMFVADPEDFSELSDEDILKSSISGTKVSELAKEFVTPQYENIAKDIFNAVVSKDYGSQSAGGVVNRTESTPQTDSIHDAARELIVEDSKPSSLDSVFLAPNGLSPSGEATGGFKPTQKEIEQASKTMEKLAADLRQQVTKSRRGRKSKK
jgi:hypothetical protein